MSIETLLSRLDKVRATGKDRWMCACPSHDDRSPSMHIRLDDSKRILINCKAGCDTYSILLAVGLDWADVMPDNIHHATQKPIKQVLYASEALTLLRFESEIVMACAYTMLKGDLELADVERLKECMQRIYKITNMADV